jgi:peptidoglycan/xylan/chitin deacetylase (PgdA/CDA1 family)
MSGVAQLRGWFVWWGWGLAFLALNAGACATVTQTAPPPSAEKNTMEVPMEVPMKETIPASDAETGVEDRADTADGAEDPETRETPDEITAGILLGFDDNYYANWEAAFPLFEQYGAKATFFVQGDRSFCLKAMARGHDIGYHTEHHVDLRQTDRATWLYETLDSARSLDIPFASFAYPFGFSEPWMDTELLKTYAVIRGFGTTPRFYTIEEIKAGVITSKSVDNTVIPDDEAFYRMITDLFQSVKAAGNVILPLTTHNIDNTAQWGIKLYRLEFLLKTATETGLRFYTYRELATCPPAVEALEGGLR